MRQFFYWSCLAAVFLGNSAFCGSALSQQKIVRWDILATVIEVTDPRGLFPDVRLGDPVRGWMSYDLGNELDEDFSHGNVGGYQNLPGFHGVSMVIENPRSGAELQFIEDRRFDALIPGTLVDIANDDDDPDNGLADWILVDVGVLPPPGWKSNWADIAVFLYGRSTILPDLSLPSELNLADWFQAIIELRDNFFHQESTEIFAEIYSLTPVAVTPGDYDSNGVVDYDDYDLWQRGFANDGSWPGVRNGDGNGDGFVDAADYVVWRMNAGAGGSASSATSLPEPGTLVFATSALLAGGVGRLGRRLRRLDSNRQGG